MPLRHVMFDNEIMFFDAGNRLQNDGNVVTLGVKMASRVRVRG